MSEGDDRLDGIERRIEELSRRVEDMSRDLSLLKGGSRAEVSAEGRPEEPEQLPPTVAADPSGDWAISRGLETLVDRYRLVHLSGLVSLVLAGALILRIIAMSSLVPLGVGAGLGLAYCTLLLAVAEWELRRKAHLHADVFAILAILILGVLLIEVTHRPGGFSRRATYAILALALGTNSILTILRGRIAPFAVGLVAAPVAGLAVAGTPFLHAHFAGVLVIAVLSGQTGMRIRRWGAPRWGPGLLSLLYLIVLGAIAGEVVRRDLPQHANARPVIALGVLSAFYALHTLSAVAVGLFRPRRLDDYESTVAMGSAIVVYASVGRLLGVHPQGNTYLGAAGAVLAVASYLVAAASYIRHGSESGSFRPLSAIGFVYSLAALPLLIGGGAGLAAAFQGLALVLAVFAVHHGKRFISFQACVLTFAAFWVLATSTMKLSPPHADGGSLVVETAWLLLTGGMTIGVFAGLRKFREPGQRFQLHRLGFGPVVLVLVLGAGVLELLAGFTPQVFLLGRRILGVAPGEGGALWVTVQTLLMAAGGTITLVVGVRLRMGGVTALGVGTLVLVGAKLGLIDAFRVPGVYLACSSAVFGFALLLSSVFYSMHRGFSGDKAADVGVPVEQSQEKGN